MLVRHGAGALLAGAVLAGGAAAQHVHGAGCEPPASCVAVSAILLGTHLRANAERGRVFTEGYLTQPMVQGSLATRDGRFELLGIVNFEGYTLRRGELSPGSYGEGYVDRRHPHTHLHELMGGANATLGAARVSLHAGKGVVPFGTEDPMMRPFVRYPANHHLAQILERALVVGALRTGPLTLEAASFNGDEPEHPSDWPNTGRLFDSWSARGTIALPGATSGSLSHARVKSPEHAAGFGLNQTKTAASVRYSGHTDARVTYALLEWARTSEWLGPRRDLWTFSSILGEVTAATRAGMVALRLERTTRPEEHRERDPFRSGRPLLDFGIVGRTRWDILSLGWSQRPGAAGFQVLPYAEVSFSRAQPLERVVVASPADAFGGLRLLSVSAGVRMSLGPQRARMGRYGAGA